MKTNTIINNIKERRSIRSFRPEPVSTEIIETLLDVATEAPNGMNQKAWHFTAVQNSELLQKLNQAIKRAFAESNEARFKERGENPNYCCYYHAPLLIIASNDPQYNWAGMDCACALQNIFLAATSLSLASCWINQVGQACDHPEVRQLLTELGIPEHHKVYGAAAIGYADPNYPIKEKKTVEGVTNIIL